MDMGHVLLEFRPPIMLSSSSSLCSGVLFLVVDNVRAFLGRGFRSMLASLLCNVALFDDEAVATSNNLDVKVLVELAPLNMLSLSPSRDTDGADGAGGADGADGAGNTRGAGEQQEEEEASWIWI